MTEIDINFFVVNLKVNLKDTEKNILQVKWPSLLHKCFMRSTPRVNLMELFRIYLLTLSCKLDRFVTMKTNVVNLYKMVLPN